MSKSAKKKRKMENWINNDENNKRIKQQQRILERMANENVVK